MPEKQQGTDLKTFFTIYGGQFVSLMGSGLTAFALGVWVLQHTHSVTQYTLTIVFAGLPGLLMAPVAGALVDRWNRRWVLFWCNLGPALTVAVYSYLLAHGQLEVWHIYIGVIFNSILGTFQWPAYIAAITMLVERKDFGRINGVLETGQAIVTIGAPAIAGLLMYMIGISRILIIDFVTFLFAAAVLLFVTIPQPEQSAEGQRAKGSIWKEAAFGWTFIRERPGLLRLLLFFALFNLVVATGGVAIMPMVLGFTNTAGVGTIMALVGVGMLLGGMLMATTGGTKRRIYGLLGGWALISVCFVLVGIRPNLWLVGAGVLLWYIAVPVINASSQAIWQSKTPPDVQGRVFAVRRMIAQFTVPIGDFSAGPLADKVFNPALMPGGALAGSAGRVIGVGPGRGIAMMLVTLAIFPALIALIGFLNPRVRNLETELPDAVRRAAPEPVPEPAPEVPEAAGEAPAQA
ncbi:MAG: MFS transporter [Acidobacteriota bacterium]|nr:MFS transporter [Acidobacteriota bacterium]